ncbi:MAG: NYN domain-containing protein [Patescibacteria group bacterium]|nr:NYN domain-containing protein [Patescibacteria group bacterium]
MKNKNKENNYAFIDAQNLYLGTKDDGWAVDIFKLRIYLKDKYKVVKAFWFIGYIKENEKFYSLLRNAGFEISFKEISKKSNGKPKGNVDVDLTLTTVDLLLEYDNAILITSDGDFASLVKYLENKNKFKVALSPNRKKTSFLLRKACGWKRAIQYLEDVRSELKKLEKQKAPSRD